MKNEHSVTERINEVNTIPNPEAKNQGVATVLSLFLPGVGQFYNGHFIWGIIWFLITPGLWLGSAGTLGWIFHILSAIQAHRQAGKFNRNL